MVFSNLIFLFVFLPIVLFLYFVIRQNLRNYVLLLASLIFYAWGEPKFVLLMLFSILINYIFGLLIEHFNESSALKKIILAVAVIGNLLLLVLFKYAQFFIDILNNLMKLNIEMEPIPLPIGISFYTFQAMSYVIDVYRKDARVQKSFFDLSLYISLFPQLVAGPIVRYNTVAEQIKKRFVNLDKFSEGVQKFILGLTKKVLLANSFGAIADGIFSTSPEQLSAVTAWIGIIAYSLQIYFDFSGYSDMAIGLGKMFGFDFLENFNYPYIARSVSEFWRRWHISLSSWFKDYVYIPLGGSRRGMLVTIRNLLIVWTITGFWHGASWTFMLWGLYFGILIVLERIGFSKIIEKLYRPLQHLYLIFIVMIGWVFFRADNFRYSFKYLQTMFGFNNNGILDGTAIIYLNDNWGVFVIGFIACTPVIPWINKRFKKMQAFETRMVPIFSIVLPIVYMLLMVFSMILLVNSTYNPFIYFRF